jgi:hypothetical protein
MTVQGNANVSASIPLPDYMWLIEQCHLLDLSKSAMIAKLISDARAREEPPHG